MKNILLIALLTLIIKTSNAQNSPLTGSGKMISKIFDFRNFDQISLRDLSGRVEVEAGKPFSIKIDIDDNLEPLLNVSVQNKRLEITLTGNRKNKLYIENTNILIKISLPQISFIEHRGNDIVAINGIKGRHFQMEKSGNGDVKLNGMVDELDITKSGNGDIMAINLMAQTVTVRSAGNGHVTVNAAKIFNANGSGNGDIKNIGSALAGPQSLKSGNGRIIDSGYVTKVSPYAGYKDDTKKKTAIQNNTPAKADLIVVYPVKGSYGIEIGSGAVRREYFPIGTRIYREAKGRELLFEITPDNREKVLVIEK